MKRYCFLTALLLCSILSMQAFGQSSNATVSGTITDTSGGIMPGVSVTATNIATGVVSKAVSNNAGVYNLLSLLPGVYKITMEKAGFQAQTFKDVQLGNAANVRLNCQLEVGKLEQNVEVNVAAGTVLLESNSSTGNVLDEESMQKLPMVNNNALDLVRTSSAIASKSAGPGALKRCGQITTLKIGRTDMEAEPNASHRSSH